MIEDRCLYCIHWQPSGGDKNRDEIAAQEREAQDRYGIQVGIAGMCGHPDLPKPVGATSLAGCECFEPLIPPPRCLGQQTGGRQ